MAWLAVDDSFGLHRKAVAAGNAALGLWARAGTYCAHHLTDGHVPMHVVRTMGTRAQAQRLVDAGLWHETDSGYCFHDWDVYNYTRADVQSRRDSDARRKRRQRANNAEQVPYRSRIDALQHEVPHHYQRNTTSIHKPNSTATNPQESQAPQVNGHSHTGQGVTRHAGLFQDSRAGAHPIPSHKDVPTDVGTANALALADDGTTLPAAKVAQRLAARYHDRVPLSKYPAVMKIARRALDAGHAADAVDAALTRLATNGRSVTVDALRIELDGSRSSSKPSTTDQRVADAQRLKGDAQ